MMSTMSTPKKCWFPGADRQPVLLGAGGNRTGRNFRKAEQDLHMRPDWMGDSHHPTPAVQPVLFSQCVMYGSMDQVVARSTPVVVTGHPLQAVASWA